NEAKFEVENELIKECFRMKYSKEDIRILISFIDWVIRLPEAYKDRVLEIIQQAQEETKMEYVPIWARDIRQEGMDQGKSEGKLEEKQEVAERMINQGFKVETIAKCLDITVEEAKKMTDKLIN
ncbi:MAG: hypothetical protein ACM3SY_22455, partial [Candidatus Omnitrophota bacterium]